jgi:hypothetical protein
MLPDLPDGDWDGDVQTAFDRLDDWVATAEALLDREDIEAIRLQVAASHLQEALQYGDALLAVGLPDDWVNDVMLECRVLHGQLLQTATNSLPRCTAFSVMKEILRSLYPQ